MIQDAPAGATDTREIQRTRFLDAAGMSGAEVTALAPDASFRRYFRVRLGGVSRLLMDAPPPRENAAAFAAVGDHLRTLGLTAPEILARDLDQGFLLLEDFGDDTFTRLLDKNHDAAVLYRLAVDTLVALNRHGEAALAAVPPYDLDALLTEAVLLPDWHFPLVHGRPVDAAERENYLDSWRDAFTALPPPALTLVLRDFHVDNLMLTAGEPPRCALLDFQDAVIGPAAYDLASLLQDARRDIDEDFEAGFVEYFLECMPMFDRGNFLAWYHTLAAQRHAKVLGIFSRLCLRDGKCHYLAHLPRVIRLLDRGCRRAGLQRLSDWLDRNLPARSDYRQPETTL